MKAGELRPKKKKGIFPNISRYIFGVFDPQACHEITGNSKVDEGITVLRSILEVFMQVPFIVDVSIATPLTLGMWRVQLPPQPSPQPENQPSDPMGKRKSGNSAVCLLLSMRKFISGVCF